MSSELRLRWQHAGGTLPSDWEIVPFEVLLRDSKGIAVGVMYPGEDTLGGIPLIKVGDIKQGAIPTKPSYCISQETNEEYKRSQLQGDELLITLVGTPGECVVVEPHMAGWNAARAIAVVRLGDPNLRVFLKAILESSPGKHLIDAVLNTTVQKTLNLKDIKQLPIPLPDRATVNSISVFSKALTDRISVLRETNATLESIAQALFKSWFVDFDPVRAKMEGRSPEGMDEATAALFPDSFEESELGLVPRGWRVGSLGSELKISYGKNLPTNKLLASGYPVYGGNGQIGYFDKYIYETRQVLIACRGAASGKVNQSARKAFITNNSLVLESDESTNLPFGYIKGYMLNSDLTAFVTGSAQPQVTIDNLKVFKLLVPCASVLRAFESLSSVFENRIEENDRQISCLAELRDALLPRLISGQLRLTEIDS